MDNVISIRRILFATDFAENSRLALDFAVLLAEHFQATIVMMHVLLLPQAAHEAEMEVCGPSVSRQSAETRLDNLAAGLRRIGIGVETHVIDGFPGDAILESIPTYEVDLLVLGIHGLHHGLTYLLMGSTTEHLVQNATCPTLTVGPHVLSGSDLRTGLEKIILLSDLSEEASRSARLAFFLGEVFAASVHEWVWLPPEVYENDERSRDLACAHARRLVRQNVLPPPSWANPDFHLSQLQTTDQIINRAKQLDGALIILGIHSLHTSFARQVLSLASCPVITVNQPSPALRRTVDE